MHRLPDCWARDCSGRLPSVATSPAHAAVIVYKTPANSTTGGQSVSAQATFTTSTNQVSILLENLQVNPKSAVQALSGLQFAMSGGQTFGSLSSSSGTQRTIWNSGAFSVGSNASTGWGLSHVGSSLMLDLLGQSTAPTHTIIGPSDAGNLYSNANSSITNGTHSPFFGMSATFVLSVPGVTASSSVSSAIFQFNTSAGNTVTGTPVPEPATIAPLAAASAGLVRRRRRKA